MPVETRLRTGVTLSVMVNLACASAAVFSATVTPNRPEAERVPDIAAPLASPPSSAVAAFVASTPVVWAAPPALLAPPPPADAAEPAAGDDETRIVSSTGYCLDGVTASGGDAGPGGVAMNGVALGSSWRVLDGSLAGSVLTVNDRIGRGSDFDVWFDDCDAAADYGRQTISVTPEA